MVYAKNGLRYGYKMICSETDTRTRGNNVTLLRIIPTTRTRVLFAESGQRVRDAAGRTRITGLILASVRDWCLPTPRKGRN